MKQFLKQGMTAVAAIVLATGAFITTAQAVALPSGTTTFDFFAPAAISGINKYMLEGQGSVFWQINSYDTSASTSDGTATLTFQVNNLSKNINGTAITPSSNVRLTAFGFGVDPNLMSPTNFQSTTTQGLTAAVVSSGGSTTIPNIQGIEICIFAGPNCAGGSNGGIYAGANDKFSFDFVGNFTANTILSFSPFGAKFQTDISSFDVSCTGTVCQSNDTLRRQNAIPEPATIATMGLGLLALCLTRRRKTR